MRQYEVAEWAIGEKARSERIFLHYALLLGALLIRLGTLLVVLGVGDHVDILISGRADLEARILNASPGVVMWIAGALIFWASKPRRLSATASHSKQDINSESLTVSVATEITRLMPFAKQKVDDFVAQGEEQLQTSVDALVILLQQEAHMLRYQLKNAAADQAYSAQADTKHFGGESSQWTSDKNTSRNERLRSIRWDRSSSLAA